MPTREQRKALLKNRDQAARLTLYGISTQDMNSEELRGALGYLLVHPEISTLWNPDLEASPSFRGHTPSTVEPIPTLDRGRAYKAVTTNRPRYRKHPERSNLHWVPKWALSTALVVGSWYVALYLVSVFTTSE